MEAITRKPYETDLTDDEYDGLCEVEACWIEWACVRWLVRRMAKEKKC